ncbi:VWA domain-containing protein [bacterium]|nr:VWA domain-containing protein [bacterium]
MEISRGFRSKLDKFFNLEQNFRVNFSIQGRAVYDFTCFGVDSCGQLSDDRYMVFYNQLRSPNSEITLQLFQNAATFTINLNRLPSSIDKLIFAVSIDGSGVMSEISSFNISLEQNQSVTSRLGRELFSNEKAIIILELYRKDGWRINLVGQGFNGGLSELLRHYGGVEDKGQSQHASQNMSSSRPQSQVVQPAQPTRLSLEKRLEKEAPALLSLAKPIRITLEKKKLTDVRARVALVLDASGSMGLAYRDGVVQQIVNKILPLAVQFDDDGELDLWIFSERFRRMPSANLQNYQSIVPRDPYSTLNLGSFNNEPPVMKDIIMYYQDSDLPAYVIFISDGGIHMDADLSSLICQSAVLPIFWQFVGVAGSGYGILQRLDTMQGRFIDNANFFALDDFNSVPNQELYDRLLGEFPQWLKEAKAKGIFNRQNRQHFNFNVNQNNAGQYGNSFNNGINGGGYGNNYGSGYGGQQSGGGGLLDGLANALFGGNFF